MSAIDPENALVWKLKSINAITALTAKRIYPGLAWQADEYPYIVIDKTPGEQRDQISGAPSILVVTKLTAYCYAEQAASGYAKAMELAGLVKTNIHPTGTTGSVFWNSIQIDHCTVGQIYSQLTNPRTGEEFGYPCAAVDITMFWLQCLS